MNNRYTGSSAAYAVIILVLLLFGVITLYPFLYTLSMSISSPMAVMRNLIRFLPIGVNLDSYGMILEDSRVWQAYYNTLWFTLVGTGLSLITTIMGGYVLSRKSFKAIPFLMVMITIPMFFSGGMVPTFVLISSLGLYNTRWAIILPSIASSWNIIITRTFFQTTIPDSVPEAAKIDGANDLQTFLRVILPVSQTIVALMTLYAAVGFWNLYFPAVLYSYDYKLHPMTVFLRNILMMSQSELADSTDLAMAKTIQFKYTAVIVSILPIICVYPFLQKYFIKGVMIGAIKE